MRIWLRGSSGARWFPEALSKVPKRHAVADVSAVQVISRVEEPDKAMHFATVSGYHGKPKVTGCRKGAFPYNLTGCIPKICSEPTADVKHAYQAGSDIHVGWNCAGARCVAQFDLS